MANAILYNQGSHPTGALKSGTMSMNVSPSLDVGALKWRNGFENNNMWVIYSDTYSQGQATQGNALPTIWATSTFTDAGLVGLINSLPARAGQIPFTNVTAATSWLRGQGVYFLSNQNYPQIVTSGLTMMMDAGFTASLPNGTGTTWYDMSGNDTTGTLINGPVWNNSGTTSFVYFDGTNDYVTLGTPSSLVNIGASNFTISCLINPTAVNTSWTGLVYLGRFGQSNGHLGFDPSNNVAGGTGDGSNWQTHQTNYPLSVNTWYNLTMVRNNNFIYFYSNGQQIGSPFSHSYTPATATQYLEIGNGSANEEFNGKISNVQIYNRALSQSEILQNYYEGPIVTSGLTLALDAGNLVSYGGTGTSWKDLTANGNNVTLINGPIYSTDGGGSFVFDGSDDYAKNDSPTLPTGNVTATICAWIYVVSGYGDWQGIVGWGNTNSSQSALLDMNQGRLAFSTWGGLGSEDLISTYNVPKNTWKYVVGSINNKNIKLYADGIKVLDASISSTPNVQSTNLRIATTDYPGRLLNTKIANVQIYNRELSINEVQQNYNAQRGRFGI
jgi:hypothetical protein